MSKTATNWRTISIEGLLSAKALFNRGDYRGCANRSYYAAYHAATAISVEHGDAINFPSGWNNPAHEQLPGLILTNGDFPKSIRSQVATALRFLRNAREDADYRPGHTVNRAIALDCLRYSASLLQDLGVSDGD